jgi:hypothetical protein
MYSSIFLIICIKTKASYFNVSDKASADMQDIEQRLLLVLNGFICRIVQRF